MSDNYIGPDAVLEGELHSRGAVSVQGRFTGELTANQSLDVLQGGQVSGKIQTTVLKVSGRLDGEVGARKSLEADKGCRIRGRLVIQPEIIIVHQDADLGRGENPEWENPPLPERA